MGTTDSYKKLADQELPGLVQILETCMQFENWGFKQSFYGVADEFAPSVIYDSDKCRIRFCWLPADMRDGSDSATLEIKYGRLHASNQKICMIWNGRNCYCWHRFDIFYFLEGLSPSEAVHKWHKDVPPVAQFIQQNKENLSIWSNIEGAARMEAFIWKYYENSLFDLFDLRRPDLWEKYMSYIQELNQLNPFRANDFRSPPAENIC